MPQYFSSAPLDYGARYLYEGQANKGEAIARGISSAANGIAGGINKVSDYRQDENMLKMRAKIEEQARQSQSERAVIEDAQRLGIAPFIGADGKVNVMATAAETMKEKDRRDRAKALTGMGDQYNFNLQMRAAELGIDGAQPANRAIMPAGGAIAARPDALQGQAAFAGVNLPPALAQRVYLKEKADKEAATAANLKMSNDATASRRSEDKRAANVYGFGQVMGRAPAENELDADGNLLPEAANAMAVAKREATTTATQRNVASRLATAQKAGLVKPGEEDEAAAAFQVPSSTVLSAADKDKLAFNLANANVVGNFSKVIKGTDKGDYGPIDNTVGRALGAMGGGNKSTDINRAYSEISSGRSFAQGGKALTQIELDQILAQIGTPNNPDFLQRFGGYVDQAKRESLQMLERLSTSPARFSAEGQAAIKQLSDAVTKYDAMREGATVGTQSGPSLQDRLNKYNQPRK